MDRIVRLLEKYEKHIPNKIKLGLINYFHLNSRDFLNPLDLLEIYKILNTLNKKEVKLKLQKTTY